MVLLREETAKRSGRGDGHPLRAAARASAGMEVRVCKPTWDTGKQGLRDLGLSWFCQD